MRRISLFFLCLVNVVALDSASAIDVSPSKQTAPPSTYEGGGNRFSIFNGDPKRIQRANAVDPKSFDSKVEIDPNPVSLKAVKTGGSSIKITFWVHNHSKKTYTLSFPTTQRWDFRILNAAGEQVYAYTDNYEFLPQVGTSMVNNDDKLTYVENVGFDDLSRALTPGVYKVQALMANYPEMNAEGILTVQP